METPNELNLFTLVLTLRKRDDTTWSSQANDTRGDGGVVVRALTEAPPSVLISAARHRDASGQTLLFCPQNSVRVWQVLIQRLTELCVLDELLDVQDHAGQTALLVATMNGNGVGVEALLRAGANVDMAELCFGHTPLHAAVYCNFPSVVSLLLRSGANTLVRDLNNETPVQLALRRENRTECLHVMEDFDHRQLALDHADALQDLPHPLFRVPPLVDTMLSYVTGYTLQLNYGATQLVAAQAAGGEAALHSSWFVRCVVNCCGCWKQLVHSKFRVQVAAGVPRDQQNLRRRRLSLSCTSVLPPRAVKQPCKQEDAHVDDDVGDSEPSAYSESESVRCACHLRYIDEVSGVPYFEDLATGRVSWIPPYH